MSLLLFYDFSMILMCSFSAGNTLDAVTGNATQNATENKEIHRTLSCADISFQSFGGLVKQQYDTIFQGMTTMIRCALLVQHHDEC